MTIRRECPSDYEVITALVKKAFESAEFRDGDEHDCVNSMRESDNYIPSLALVAEENDKIIGHIMLSKMKIKGDDHNIYTELMLSPLCVALEYRGKGIGAALVEESKFIAKNMGYSAIFLSGNPNYYGKFGFFPTTIFGIRHVDDIPEHYVLACELYENALYNKQGTIDIVTIDKEQIELG